MVNFSRSLSGRFGSGSGSGAGSQPSMTGWVCQVFSGRVWWSTVRSDDALFTPSHHARTQSRQSCGVGAPLSL